MSRAGSRPSPAAALPRAKRNHDLIGLTNSFVAMVKERKAPDLTKFAKEEQTHADTLRERKMRAFMPAWLSDVKTRTKISYNTALIGEM